MAGGLRLPGVRLAGDPRWLDRLVAQGCSQILAVPGMLFAAGHAKNDIPSVLNTYQFGRPGLTISMAASSASIRA
jgi:hypothetical protein